MMSRIGVAGKGGSGKTTVAALLTRHLLTAGMTPVLAIDADSNSNLHEVLGVEVARTVGDIREAARQAGGAPPGTGGGPSRPRPDMASSAPSSISMPKWEWLRYEVETAIAEARGFDLLAMGRSEGPGCYCYVNELMREIIRRVAGRYRSVVIDNEAGLEHLSRRTAEDLDHLFIVADPSPRSLGTARRIQDLALAMGSRIRSMSLLLNRTDGAGNAADVASGPGLTVAGAIPEDEEVARFDRGRRSLLELPEEAPAYRASREIFDRVIRPPR